MTLDLLKSLDVFFMLEGGDVQDTLRLMAAIDLRKFSLMGLLI